MGVSELNHHYASPVEPRASTTLVESDLKSESTG